MKCSNCNHEIYRGQEVCLVCGHILRYESEETKICVHCNRLIPISYKKCPYCKKKQESKALKVLSMLMIFLIIIINIICFYGTNVINFSNNIDKYHMYITYEDIVRKNKEYDETYLSLTGNIISVEKVSKLINIIKIQIYVEDNQDNIINVYYVNNKNIGLLKNDKITIYGKYKRLKGNTPEINAQIIMVD